MGYSVSPVVTTAFANTAFSSNLIADSAGTLYGLGSAAFAPLLKLIGAAWSAITPGAPSANQGALLRITADDRIFSIATGISNPSLSILEAVAGAWVVRDPSATIAGLAYIRSCAVVGNVIYFLFEDSGAGTTSCVVSWDGSNWSQVTAYAPNISADGRRQSLFGFAGNLYNLAANGAVYSIAGGVMTTVVLPGIWTTASIAAFETLPTVLAVSSGRLYIPNVAGTAPLVSGSLWSWDGVAGAWVTEAPTTSTINTHSPSLGLFSGDIYLAQRTANPFYKFSGGALTSVGSLTTSQNVGSLLNAAGQLYLFSQGGASPKFNVGLLMFTSDGAPGGGALPAFVPGF